LWFPKAFSGKRRKHWLEEHIGQPDLQNDTERERERIQAIIDDYFGLQATCPMDDILSNKIPSKIPGANISLEREDCTTMRSLIAHEKAAGAHKQYGDKFPLREEDGSQHFQWVLLENYLTKPSVSRSCNFLDPLFEK
jgi:hypothetical protein